MFFNSICLERNGNNRQLIFPIQYMGKKKVLEIILYQINILWTDWKHKNLG